MKRTLSVLFATLLLPCLGHGQATTTASRIGDLQVGGGFTTANSDYTVNRITGFAFYTDFDLSNHYGVEGDFHQVNDPNSAIYERSYELGGRYFWKFGRTKPYVKALFGRGVFNFPFNQANLAYNMMVGGGGADFVITPRINARADFEYQSWFSGPGISNGLTPTLITIGVAYHFPAGRPR